MTATRNTRLPFQTVTGGESFKKIFTIFINSKNSRSILTVPWIELGGSVTINCPQTGYHADVEFLTKPFYGGRRNKITTEVRNYFKIYVNFKIQIFPGLRAQ